MSEKIPTPQTEEVDLGKLFQVIGNGFKNLFNSIGKLLKKLFHYFISLLIFFKKNALIIGAATILAGILGYVLDMDKTIEYQSDMIIDTNYGSGHQLYSQQNYLNALIERGDTKKLAEIFNISDEDANTLTGFATEPNDIKNSLLREFDYYMQHTDTIYTRDLTVGNYSKRLDLPDYKVQKITAYATNQTIFSNLNKGVINLVENEHYKNLLKLKLNEYGHRKVVLQKNLGEIDSLRKRYREVALLNAKKTTVSGTNISLAEKQNNSNKDVDLFTESNKILGQLKGLDTERIRNGFITTVLSEFHLGVHKTSIRSEKWFKFAVLGFLLSLMAILGLKLNNYLNNYQK